MGGPSGGFEMVDARDISNKQKQIAVSEFFEKNKHFLGSVSYTHLTLPTN